MKKLIFILIFVLIVSSFGLAAQEKNKDGFKSISSKDITLKWKIEGKNLHILVYAKTKGWLAVGFNPTKRMKDANIIIGYVKKGKFFIRDDYGVSIMSHKADTVLKGKNNILKPVGKEKDGITTMEFSIPLSSGDKFDRKLVAGKEYRVLLAYGKKDNFTSYHAYRAAVEITL